MRVEEEPEMDKTESPPRNISSSCRNWLFGSGMARSSGECGEIIVIFGSCQQTSQHSENINKLANSFNSLNDYVMDLMAQ